MIDDSMFIWVTRMRSGQVERLESCDVKSFSTSVNTNFFFACDVDMRAKGGQSGK